MPGFYLRGEQGARAGMNKGRPDSSRKVVEDGARDSVRAPLQIRPTFDRGWEPDSTYVIAPYSTNIRARFGLGWEPDSTFIIAPYRPSIRLTFGEEGP